MKSAVNLGLLPRKALYAVCCGGFFVILLATVGCNEVTEDDEAVGASTPAASTFDDPFAYCAAVGTVDAPDERYMGEAVPMVIAEGIRQATGGSLSAPIEFFTRGTTWRCMEGAVMACTVGANLPCQTEADTSKAPSQAMTEFCQANQDSSFIPAAITGRATVYTWRCSTGRAVAGTQVNAVDQRGFIANIWYRLERR
jgi:hypothetical protein